MPSAKRNASPKRRFTATITVDLIIDESLIKAVTTDEWRKEFYDIHNGVDVAEHLAFNLVQGRSLASLDGFADRLESEVTLDHFSVDQVDEL